MAIGMIRDRGVLRAQYFAARGARTLSVVAVAGVLGSIGLAVAATEPRLASGAIEGSDTLTEPTVTQGPVPGRTPTGRYVGSDPAGAVSFRLYAVRHKGAHSSAALSVGDFQFANRCAATGVSTITQMRFGPRDRFGTVGPAGIVVGGAVHRYFTGDFFQPAPPNYPAGETGVARGLARVRTANCDSGKLTFTATWSG